MMDAFTRGTLHTQHVTLQLPWSLQCCRAFNERARGHEFCHWCFVGLLLGVYGFVYL